MRLWRWETETELASLPDLMRMPPCFHPKLPLLAIAEIRKVVLFNLANKQVEEKIPVEVRVIGVGLFAGRQQVRGDDAIRVANLEIAERRS